MTRTLALVIAVFALAAPSAPAAWKTESVPSSDALQANSFAFDQSGRGLLAWEGHRSTSPRKFTAISTRSVDGGWTQRGDIADITWGAVEVKLFGRDRALMTAMKPYGTGRFNRAKWSVVAAFGRSDGSFGKLRTLDRDATNPIPAISSTGHAAVVWYGPAGEVRLALRRPRQSRFSRARTISPRGASAYAVAVNARGDVLVAWGRAGQVEVRIRRAGDGRWGRRTVVGGAELGGVASVRAALSDSGRALVTWASSKTLSETGPVELEHGFAYLDRGWRNTTLEQYARPAYSGTPVVLPLITAGGRSYVAWSGPTGDRMKVKVARVTRNQFKGITYLPGVEGPVDDFAGSEKGVLAVSWSVPSMQSGPFVSVSSDGRTFGAPADLHVQGKRSLAPSLLSFRFETPALAWTDVGDVSPMTIRTAFESPG